MIWKKANSPDNLHKYHKMNRLCHGRKQAGRERNILKRNGQQRKWARTGSVSQGFSVTEEVNIELKHEPFLILSSSI